MKCLCILFLTLNVCDTSNVGVFLSINVKGCEVIGRKSFTILENRAFAVFWDIPYAEPPLWKLRFKPPKMKYWHNGTYDYSNPLRNVCKCCYNEDCLYLNVYMPISTNETWNLPVIVWLNNDEEHLKSPDFLLEEEVVVVIVTYRQTIFGFLNTDDGFAEGNMGAKDVITSLKWIKNYISSFDGDPNRVTVIGAKSAAVLVSSLILSSAAEGLMSKAIILSYSAVSPAYYRNCNFDVLNKLYWNLNGPFDKLNRTNLYEMLVNYSTCELIEASKNMFDSTEVRDNQRPITAFGPCIDSSNEAFMNEHPLNLYKARLSNKIDVMMGYTSLESLYKLEGFAKNRELLKYLNYNFQYLLPFEGPKDEYGSKRYSKIREKIMGFYFVNGTIGVRSLRRYAKYVSDQEIYPLLRQARLHAAASCGSVYLYRFAFRGALNAAWNSSVRLNWAGATSGDEICYLFKCKSVVDVYNNAGATNERHFIKRIARLLANFAKCGNPTPNTKDDILDDLHWEPLTAGKKIRAMNLNQKFKMIDVPEEIRMNFWDQLKNNFFPEKLPKDEL